VRRLAVVATVVLGALVLPAAALAHDAPENDQSKWVMADWMIDTFFVFGGLALLTFLVAWKLGHFQDVEQAASIPLLVEEEDYYTPEWALDEEEWS
jgi:hypothetical protein